MQVGVIAVTVHEKAPLHKGYCGQSPPHSISTRHGSMCTLPNLARVNVTAISSKLAR